MATAGFAAAEQEGTYNLHQTITCHYHVFAPTTVHMSPGETRCVSESSSEVTATSLSPTASTYQCPGRVDEASVHRVKLDIENIDTSKPEGKRQAVLQWLILRLVLLLQKISH